MTSLLVSAGYSGASITVSGSEIQNTYAGDGHVVGPVITTTTGSGRHHHTTTTYVPWTLGDSTYNSNGTISAPTSVPSSYGNFLTNATNVNPNSTTITMVFDGFSVSAISFAFEIFPDASETKTNPADFTFRGLDSSNNLVNMSSYSVISAYTGGVLMSGTSGTSWTVDGVAPGSSTGDYTHSPNSKSGTETYQQLLGTATITFETPVTTFEFEDWPATIGINNLSLTPYVPPVQPQNQLAPAPPSAVLLGLGGLIFLGILARSCRRLLATA